jgi:hypothetical protein
MNAAMHLRGEIEVVSDCHHGLAVQRHQVAEDAKHLRGGNGIEAPGRFVRENDRRIVGERPGDCDPLALTSG